MTAIVTRGDAGNLHLPDETVDLIVTSPPYFGLRSYQDGGEHYAEQIGAEATPAEYLDALMTCTAEWMRVLKPGGSIFVNLGDKYAGNVERSRNGQGQTTMAGRAPLRDGPNYSGRRDYGVPVKSLTGLPWRYAIRCIDELGLILRAEIVWAKPNGLPESVTDRVRRSHEQVFHFVKQSRYYSAVDEVREGHLFPGRGMTPEERRIAGRIGGRSTRGAAESDTPGQDNSKAGHPLGKLPGSVWEIPTAPLKVPDHLGIDHFAAYPPDLVRRIVLGWSPREVCTACGEGRAPVADRSEKFLHRPGGAAQVGKRMVANGPDATTRSNVGNVHTVHRITGYACACPDVDAPATPGVVLDPFGGTGTTALVAHVHGRTGISVDLSADYCRLAQWRTTDPGERARVLKVEKPPAQVDGQLGMFEGIGA